MSEPLTLEVAATYDLIPTITVTIIDPNTHLQHTLLPTTTTTLRHLRQLVDLLTDTPNSTFNPCPTGRFGWIWQLHQSIPP